MEKVKVIQSGGSGAMFWIAGWIFTIAFLKLSFWEGVLAVIIWPYSLGNAMSGMIVL